MAEFLVRRVDGKDVTQVHTKRIEEIYQNIANLINEFIPEDWSKVCLYARVNDYMSKIFFYYYPENSDKPIYFFDMRNIYDISENEFYEMYDKLEEPFEELREVFKINQMELWTDLTLIIESDGNFKIDYSYEDFSDKDDYEEHVKWKYKYLGIIPPESKKREYSLIQNYIESLKETEEK